MDDQHPFPFAAGPEPAPEPAPEAAPEPGHPRPRRARRLLASVSATALVAGVGGVGAGYALGHRLPGGSQQAASAGSSQSSTAFGGTLPVPGSDGTGAWPDGGQAQDQPQDQAPGQSGDTTATAAGSQLTGLVRIVATMKYDGGKAAGTGRRPAPAWCSPRTARW